MAPGTCSLLVLVLRGPPTVIFAASSTANSRSAYQGLSAPPSFRTPQDRFSQSARLPPRAPILPRSGILAPALPQVSFKDRGS